MKRNQRSKVEDAIREIISIEESASPDWSSVFEIADEVLRFIVDNKIDGKFDPYIVKFLDDSDVRKKDTHYGEYQRKKVLNLISSGKSIS